MECSVEVDSNSLAEPHASNKDGIDNAELPNVQQVETKEGTTTLPVDEPDGKDSGGELAMEEEEDALETKFPNREHDVEPTDVK